MSNRQLDKAIGLFFHAFMSQELKQLSEAVAAQISKQARRFRASSLFVKIVLVSVFSAVAAIAQFVQFPATGPEPFQIIGIMASLVVFIGGIFVVITEQDAAEQLTLAQQALETAREAESKYEIIGELEDANGRLIELFQAMSLMRGAVEHLAINRSQDEEQAVAKMMRACERSLIIAMGFAQQDQWTIGVYKALPSDVEDNRAVLKCIAHKRAIECDPSEARVWKEGTGITGVAYSNGDEIIVPDLQAIGMRAVFGTSANERREYDADRYRSMVAVPIKVEGMDKPWGVVTATTDYVGHFSPDVGRGLSTHEGARTLAAMVALAIAVIRKRS